MNLTWGGAYAQRANGRWRHPEFIGHGPKLGLAVQLVRDNVAGDAAGQILALATGLQQTKRPDGTTLYTGTIPDSSADPGVTPADDAILRMITNLRSGNEAGAPDSFRGDLKLG